LWSKTCILEHCPTPAAFLAIALLFLAAAAIVVAYKIMLGRIAWHSRGALGREDRFGKSHHSSKEANHETLL
jgi:hypothetical protein